MNWKWLAGFYEGEGYVATVRHKRKRGHTVLLHLTISQKEKAILKLIQAHLEAGGIHKSGRVWALFLYGKAAEKFAVKIQPHMQSPRKKLQLKTALKFWRAR